MNGSTNYRPFFFSFQYVEVAGFNLIQSKEQVSERVQDLYNKVSSIPLHCIRRFIFSGQRLSCYRERSSIFIQERLQTCAGAGREKQGHQRKRRHIPDCIHAVISF